MANNNCRRLPILTQEEREDFWKIASGKTNEECWEWGACRFSNGYGCWYKRKEKPQRCFRAHRIAYSIAYGVDPLRLFVIHSCDNRACCNPAHLRLGTHLENMADMVTRKRGMIGDKNFYRRFPDMVHKGEAHYKAILTEADVLHIRHLRASGSTYSDISIKVGTSKSNIRFIVQRKTWSHVP